jgi:hypothetical protein
LVPDRLSSFLEHTSRILDGFLKPVNFWTDFSFR